MTKKVKKPNWTPVQLDSSLFAGGIDGLIGIEKCEDYKFDKSVSNCY